MKARLIDVIRRENKPSFLAFSDCSRQCSISRCTFSSVYIKNKNGCYGSDDDNNFQNDNDSDDDDSNDRHNNNDADDDWDKDFDYHNYDEITLYT